MGDIALQDLGVQKPQGAPKSIYCWKSIPTMAEHERIAAFIDGANLYGTARGLGFDIDYRLLLGELQSRGRLIRAYYYAALLDEQEHGSPRPLIDWLDYNGYTVITKPAKEFVDSVGRRKVKGRIDVELGADALRMADRIDHMFLFSGDGDFRSLIEAVQRKGVRVSVVSTITTRPPMLADELRRQADEFVDLVDLMGKVGRDPAERLIRMPRNSVESVMSIEVQNPGEATAVTPA